MDRVGGAGTRWLVVGDAQAKRCGAVCAEWAGRYCREAVVAAWFGWGWPDYRSARRGWLSAADFTRRHALLFPVYVSDTFAAVGHGFAWNNRVCVRSRWRALAAHADIGPGSSY